MAFDLTQTGEQVQQLLNDIPGKELSSNKTNQWSASPSATKYPTEALVANRFEPLEALGLYRDADGYICERS